MKQVIFSVAFLLIVGSCSTDAPKEETMVEVVTETRDSIEVDANGNYKEWYPGFKQVKITGQQDADGKRNGVWKLYSEQGLELSITAYTNGMKNGISIVYHPNGVLHYRGEYINDEKTGVWKFYDTAGELVQKKDFTK